MRDREYLVIELTEQQREEIREATGRDAVAIRLKVEELEQSIWLGRYRPC